jgi:hypothetical protein
MKRFLNNILVSILNSCSCKVKLNFGSWIKLADFFLVVVVQWSISFIFNAWRQKYSEIE